MTTLALRRRLERIERRRNATGLEHLSDAQLWSIIRSDYPALAREHGSLSAAIQHLALNGEPVIASLITEDVGEAVAVRH